MAPKERARRGRERQAGREGELHHRFVRLHDLARVTGAGTSDWRAPARRRVLPRAPQCRGARRLNGYARAGSVLPGARRRLLAALPSPDARRSAPTSSARRRSCRRSSRRSGAGSSPHRAQTSRKARGGRFFMIRSLTRSCRSSWCPTRRSRRTRPLIARRWRSSMRRAPASFRRSRGLDPRRALRPRRRP